MVNCINCSIIHPVKIKAMEKKRLVTLVKVVNRETGSFFLRRFENASEGLAFFLLQNVRPGFKATIEVVDVEVQTK
jgi:hypothetical protein